MPIEIKIPEVGESITEAFINEWLKSEGDHVEKDEIIAELETDKVSFELPAPAAGTLTKILKSKGDSASIGEVIGQMEEGGQGAGEKSGKKAEKKQAAGEKTPQPAGAAKEGAEPAEGEGRGAKPAASPDERDRGAAPNPVGAAPARESNAKSRTESEAEPAGDIPPISARLAAEATADGQGREEEVIPMSPIRQTIARRLVQAQQVAALLTTFNEVDLSAVNELRRDYRDRFEQRYGVKLGFMSFFIKAAVDALKAFPAINAEVDDRKIVYRNYYDIGVAVSTDKGLVVPVLRDADRLSFAEIESAVNDFARRARDNELGMKDIRGGTFTITNGGVFGSLLSTPIVNPPQSGVLGMHTIQDRPVARDGQVVIRPMMYLALTYDHRIVDGREAVTFLRRIREAVEEPARLLMEV